jgi:hypothetical protein
LDATVTVEPTKPKNKIFVILSLWLPSNRIPSCQ